MRRAPLLARRLGPAVLAPALLALAAGPVAAHHLGAWAPQDNEISANFKQIKFSLQARKFDAALRLFDAGAVRAEMRAQARRLPAGLEAATRAALVAGDGARAERGCVVFLAALIRDLALDADRRLADGAEPAAARAATGLKFLEAIWRYYNLVDFAVSQYDPKAAVAIRLAVEDAESHAQRGGGAGEGRSAPASSRGTTRPVAAPAPEKMREPLQRIARILSGLIETSITVIRRDS